MTAIQMILTTYHGNCHCGRFRFELTAPEIAEAIICACKLCSKKGYLWLNTAASGTTYTVTRDDDKCLTEYDSAALKDRFCKYCGTGITGLHSAGPLWGQLLVNIRTLQEVNPFTLKCVMPLVSPAPPEDVSTTHRISDEAQHLSSCHCGKVQAELLVPITDLEVKEDNCSSCVRNAYIGVYPTKDQVKIHGREHTFEYLYGRKFNGTAHCKTCGVAVFSNVYGPPLSVFDSLPAERKERVMAVYRKNMALQPLNVRAIDGLDIELLQIKRTDEGTEGYVLPP
ncbi:hypothetical protein B0H66DRAFT_628999 [Apodospora peruviana]|uniref:CENP-V/GFA domain-containing protein n=1 Tax=Apodospora peruviana TaxID=516989 RepID=A0AAE0LZ51_9PEZI|nr:hypothetical protein B0H66DRAFT_628999 [Apodospora peruviana]